MEIPTRVQTQRLRSSLMTALPLRPAAPKRTVVAPFMSWRVFQTPHGNRRASFSNLLKTKRPTKSTFTAQALCPPPRMTEEIVDSVRDPSDSPADDNALQPDRRLYPMKRQRKSENWEFVFLVADDAFRHVPLEALSSDHASGAFCTRCSENIKFAKGQTTSVAQHMRESHAVELHELRARKKQRTQAPLENAFATVPEGTATDATAHVTTDEEQAFANQLLASWLAGSHRPFNMVNDAGFHRYISYLLDIFNAVGLELPSRTTVANDVSALAEQLRASLRQRIRRDCEFFHVTTDIWSDRAARSYIALTVHYLEQDFTLNDWTLEVQPIPGKHDAQAIADSLRSMFGNWGLSTESCVRLVRDGASNGVAAAIQLGVSSFSCLAHSLHLVVSGVMMKKVDDRALDLFLGDEREVDDELNGTDVHTVETLDDLRREAHETVDAHVASSELPDELRKAMKWMRNVVQVFRSLAIYFKNSPKAKYRLLAIRNDLQRELKMLFQLDCPTRWSSTYKMLNHFVKLKMTVDTFFVYLATPRGKDEFERVKLVPPTAQQWFAIQCLVRLLEPFAAAVDHLGGSQYPTMAVAVPVLRHVRTQISSGAIFDADADSLDDADMTEPVITILERVRQALCNLFRRRFAGLDDALLWVSILDPRLSELQHLDEDEQVQARESALDEIAEAAAKLGSQGSQTNPPTFTMPTPTPEKARKKLTEAVYGQRVQTCSPSVRPSSLSPREQAEQALKAYLRDAKHVGPDVNPLEWWRDHAQAHPVVARVARKWMSCVATSVPSERAFSTGGNIVTAKRSALSPETVRDAVFIAQNASNEFP